MKKLTWIYLLLACTVFSVSAQDEEAPPDTIQVGVYFNSVYDLDLAAKSFTVDFWAWYNYTNDSIQPLEYVEISNAKEYEFNYQDVEKLGKYNWATHKCKAVIKKDWDLRNFPFDKQVLEVNIEDAMKDVSMLVYVPDTENSKYDESIVLDGWVIKKFSLQHHDHTYKTTYGNPELEGTSTYPSVVARFELERDGIGLFFKLFMGVYVAYLISLSVFFMGPENPERFGMIVGALFAGVANKYIVDSIMPQTIMLTLPDKIHNVTFAYIIIHLAITVWAFRLSVKEKMKQGWLLDRLSFLISIISFIAINWWLISKAL